MGPKINEQESRNRLKQDQDLAIDSKGFSRTL